MSKPVFDISTCARPNILALDPYRCARDDYKDDGTNCLLDANENAYGPGLSLDSSGRLSNPPTQPNGTSNTNCSSTANTVQLDLRGLNRYPDPHQADLKHLLCAIRHGSTTGASPLTPDNLFVGVGSDEAIDGLIRCFCTPGKDKILICPPTYGMYTVSASVNDVGVVKVPLLPASDFSLDVPSIIKVLQEEAAQPPSLGRIKLVFLCSPGNPTGKLIPKSDVEAILAHPTFNGVVVLDEAYIDFSPAGSSFAAQVNAHPNLVVMQTLSKAFGLAGIRLGAAFTSPPIARLMNSMKAPYNVSSLTSQLACQALSTHGLQVMQKHQSMIRQQRDRMIHSMPSIPGVGKFKGGFDSNFLLVEMLDAPGGKPDNPTTLKVYEMLAEKLGVVCRFRGREHGCEGCLRVTVGTEEEVTRFLKALETTLKAVFANGSVENGIAERKKELAESAVVA